MLKNQIYLGGFDQAEQKDDRLNSSNQVQMSTFWKYPEDFAFTKKSRMVLDDRMEH